MNPTPAPWAMALVRYRTVFAAGIFFATLLCALLTTRLQINFSFDQIFISDDPAYAAYKDLFLPAFGERASAVLIAVHGTPKQTADATFFLHHELSQLKGLTDVRSLANSTVYAPKDGILTTQTIYNSNGQADPYLLTWAHEDPAYGSLFVSKDHTTMSVVARMPYALGQQQVRDQLAESIKLKVEESKERFPQVAFYVTGIPVIQQSAGTILKNEQLIFLPLVFLLMGILLWVVFREWHGVLLPFIATIIGTIWGVAWLVMMGHALNVVNNAIIVLLVVKGVTMAILIYARYQDEWRLTDLASAHDFRAAHDSVVARTIQTMTFPSFLATATTALGLASAAGTGVTIVRHFGMDAAMGMMISFAADLLVLPALLSFFPASTIKQRHQHSPFMTRLLQGISHFSQRNANALLMGAVALGFGALYFAKDIRSNQMMVSELPPQDPSVQSLMFIQDNMTGIMPIEILFQGDANFLQSPQFIQKASLIAEKIKALNPDLTVRSYTDVLASLNHTLTYQKPQTAIADWPLDTFAQLQFLINLSDPAQLKETKREFYAANDTLYSIQVLLKDVPTQTVMKTKHAIEDILLDYPVAPAKAHITGATIVMTDALDRTFDQMAESLLLAVGTIFLLVMLLFRSFKFSLIVLLPNLLPIVFTLAAMELLGVTMRVATIITFSLALGITVDNCIYFLARFREEADNQKDIGNYKHALAQILDRTMMGSGRPIIYSVLILLIGFSVLFFSSFGALKDFAYLAFVLLSSALLVDLLLLPPLVMLARPSLSRIAPKPHSQE